MKKGQKFVAIILCCFLASGGLLQVFAQGSTKVYSDVKAGDWFYDVVSEATRRGILSGYPDGSFKPEKNVSYGEFLAMSLALEEFTRKESYSHWAEPYYDHAVKMGYIQETDFSVSDLDKTIPRKDMALVMAGLITARKLNTTGTALSFSDVDSSASHGEFIGLCASAGVLSGYPDGSFRPEGYLKRSEAAMAVMNYVELIDDSLDRGTEVVSIDENCLTYLKDDGSYEVVINGDMHSEATAPDPNAGIHPVNLMRSDHKELLEQIIATAKFSGTSGHYSFSYTQPEISERYFFSVQLTVYKANSQGGDDVLFFKNSAAGWMADRSKYDPSAQTLTWDLGSKVENIEDRAIILTFRLFDLLDEDGNFGEGAIFQFCQDYDETVERISYACKLVEGEFKEYYRYDDMSCSVFPW